MKKILALVLALVMLLSLLAACNNTKPVETQPKETNKPVETKPAETHPQETEDPGITFPLAENVEYSVMITMGNSAYSLNDNLAWKYLQEMSNITFDTIEFAPNDASEKLNLMMSSGEYADVLFKCNQVDANKYGMDGILIPLEDLIKEYMPNLSAILDERNAWDRITAPDGHIYGLPNFNKTAPNADSGMCWWINKGWLDKLGLSEPTSVEDLYNVLKAFKEKDPNGNGLADEVPICAWNTHSAYNALLGYFGHGQSYGSYWMVVDGELTYLPTTEWFKENTLEFYNKLYTEGLINADMFTMARDQYRASCGAEEVIYGMVWDSSCGYFADDNERFNWIALKPFEPDAFGLNQGISTNAFSVTDKCENPEIILTLIDYLYTEEGGRVIRLGIEDVSYKINEDGTYSAIEDGFEAMVYQATLMGSANVPGMIPDLYNDMPADEADRWNAKEWYGEDYGIGSRGIVMPNIKLTTEESDEYKILHTDIQAYVQNYIAECVTGLISIEETWDDFQATLKEMGVERMLEVRGGAWDRVNAG